MVARRFSRAEVFDQSDLRIATLAQTSRRRKPPPRWPRIRRHAALWFRQKELISGRYPQQAAMLRSALHPCAAKLEAVNVNGPLANGPKKEHIGNRMVGLIGPAFRRTPACSRGCNPCEIGCAVINAVFQRQYPEQRSIPSGSSVAQPEQEELSPSAETNPQAATRLAVALAYPDRRPGALLQKGLETFEQERAGSAAPLPS